MFASAQDFWQRAKEYWATGFDFAIYSGEYFEQEGGGIDQNAPTPAVKLALLNRSIVILAQGQAVSILHPSFLSSEGIVPPEWKTSEPPVCTPTVSIVKYTNGITFLLDQSKLVVRDDTEAGTTRLDEVTEKCIGKLAEVRCSAVGINFCAFSECSNPGAWITDRFLRKGPGNEGLLVPKVAGIKLTYSAEPGDLNLSCDAGTVQKPGDPRDHECLLINANYHTPVSAETGAEALDRAITYVGFYGKRLANFTETVDIILVKKSEIC